MIALHQMGSRSRAWGAALAAAWLMAGCGSLPPAADAVGSIGSMVTPYRIDVVQGNFVSREQVEALRPGMPKPQVRDMLGTPLLMSVFHANRWDYVFSYQRPGEVAQRRRVTVFFEGDLLDRVEADPLPSEAEFVASLAGRRKPGEPPVLQASEQALAEFARQQAKAAGSAADAPAADAPAADAPAAPPLVNYPPLEPPQ